MPFACNCNARRFQRATRTRPNSFTLRTNSNLKVVATLKNTNIIEPSLRKSAPPTSDTQDSSENICKKVKKTKKALKKSKKLKKSKQVLLENEDKLSNTAEIHSKANLLEVIPSLVSEDLNTNKSLTASHENFFETIDSCTDSSGRSSVESDMLLTNKLLIKNSSNDANSCSEISENSSPTKEPFRIIQSDKVCVGFICIKFLSINIIRSILNYFFILKRTKINTPLFLRLYVYLFLDTCFLIFFLLYKFFFKVL